VLNPLPPQDSENTITSRIGSGGFCRHLKDANLRVAANYLAVNAIVLMLQKDCDWFDPRRCRTKLPRLHPAPRSNWREFFRATRKKLSHIGCCDWQGAVVKPPTAPKLSWEGGDRKIFPQIIVAQLPFRSANEKNTCNTHT
jgi:hypothetical protein